MQDRLLLTVEQAAERLGWGRTATYQKVLSGEIESIKLGRSRRIPVSALDEFVTRLRIEQGGPVAG